MLMQHDFMPLKVMIPHFGYYNPVVGVEIGVSTGSGTISMLRYMPNLTLYSIDPWKHLDDVPGEEHFESALSQEIQDDTYRTAILRTSEFGVRSLLLRRTSDDAVKEVPEKIDYVFIDGDHNYKQVVKDINNYAPKVRTGGIVAGHDYLRQNGVSNAVDEYFKDKVINLGADLTWWVYV